MDLQLHQLRAVQAVVDHGTFEAAAQALQVTPSAVSQRIKALEVEVGRVLVLRTKPVRVTESGAAVLRLARQVALLEHDAAASLGVRQETADGRDATPSPVRIPIVVNADSLGTWVMPALAAVPTSLGAFFEVFREDQDHSVALLRDGAVMAAVTSVATPVQGCTARRLGRMRYRPMASPGYLARWFPDGATPEALAVAPVVDFDRKDDLQHRYLRRRSRRALDPPRHYIPATADYAEAVKLGMGWGMLPDHQSVEPERSGDLVSIEAGAHLDVPLYWQQWRLHSAALSALAESIAVAAARHLR